MNQYNLQKVVRVLLEKGYSEEQISQILAEITKAASVKFYAEAALSFIEEDFKAIEDCEDQKSADEEIAWRYRLRTGKDIKEEMEKYFENFSKGFIEEAEKGES